MNRIFNPFRYIAGTKSLVLGIIFILSSSLLLYSGGMIQDSYVHIALADVSLWQVVLAQFAWWLIPAILLYTGGLFMSRSHIRIIDVLGTTAFSQLLLLPLIAPMLLPAVKNGTLSLLQSLQQGTEPVMGDMIALIIYALWSTLFLILFFVWNYNAFATSCNVKGAKAIIYFIAIQVLITILGSIV